MIAELLASTTLLAAPTPGEAAATAPPPQGSDTRRVLVTFAPNRAAEGIAAVDEHDGTVKRTFLETRSVAAELPEDEIARLQREGAVTRVEPDPLMHAFALGDAELDPSPFNGLYGLLTTRALAAQSALRAEATTVCVADTGIDTTHPDIAPEYAGGVDTIDNDNDPSAPLGGDETHGTHVDGTIVGALNGYGVRGVAPGVRLFHARVLGPGGTGYASGIMEGVRRLVDEHGCSLINMSLGGGAFNATIARFYADMKARGVMIIAASGNDAASNVSFPAAYEGVLSVGAVNRSNAHAVFSNVGDGLDVAGPGVDVLSAVPRGMGRTATMALPNAAPVEVMEVGNSGLTDGVSANVVDAGNGASAATFTPERMSGQIALVSVVPGLTLPPSDLATAALNAGAAALVIGSAGPNADVLKLRGMTTTDGRPWLPVITLTADQAAAARQAGVIAITNKPSDWGYKSGTSMAAPHVTGVAAILRAVRPSLTPDQVEQALESTAIDLGPSGYDTTYGNGLVDAERAVAAVRALG